MTFIVQNEQPELIELVWQGNNSQEFLPLLKAHLDNHPDYPKVIKISWSDAHHADFNAAQLVHYAQERKFAIELNYEGNDPAVKQLLEEYITRLQLAENTLSYFEPQYNEKNHVLNLKLLPDTLLNFTPDNPAYIELKQTISRLGEGHQINIIGDKQAVNPNAVEYLLKELIGLNKAYLLKFYLAPEQKQYKSLNTQLENVYLYTLRAKGIQDIPVQENEGYAAKGKMRRNKQLLLQGKKITAQTQYQYQHQHQHAQQQQQQNQQQLNQNIYQQRLAQINQQHHQQQAEEQQQVNIAALGKLIHDNNLSDLVTDKLPLERIRRVWQNLVGEYNTYVTNPHARITHVPETTFRIILEHEEQFTYGVDLHDLPNGFKYTVQKQRHYDEEEQSILFFDPKALKTGEQRADSPLSPWIKSRPSPQPEGDVGQFYNFFGQPYNELDYQQFTKQHQKFFKAIAPNTQKQVSVQLNALKQLLNLEQPEGDFSALLDKKFSFNAAQIQGLRTVLVKYGARGVGQLLNNLNKIYRAGQYELFQKVFLDTNTDWTFLLSQPNDVQAGALGPADAIDYLISMSAVEKSWWQTLALQHAQHSAPCDLVDLVNAHRYFFAELKKIDADLDLPIPCPIENIRNIKLTYRRILTLLQNAMNPHEQVKYLEGLDYGMQGFIAAPMGRRRGEYNLITREMDLTPKSQLMNWAKYEKYLSLLEIVNDKTVTQSWPYDYIKPPQMWAGYQIPRPIRKDSWIDINFYLISLQFDDYRKTLYLLEESFHPLARDKLSVRHDIKVDFDDQEEINRTSTNQINYAIDIHTIYDMAKRLRITENFSPYFYRYIGSHPRSFDYSTYLQLVQLLEQNLIHQHPLLQNCLQKNLMVLLTLCTTGRHAYQENRDPVHDLEQLLNLIKQNPEFYTSPRDPMPWEFVEKKEHDVFEPYHIYFNLEGPNTIQYSYLDASGPVSGQFSLNEIGLNSCIPPILVDELKKKQNKVFEILEQQRFPGKGFLSRLLAESFERRTRLLQPKPTLHELTLLLKLTTDIELINDLFVAVGSHGVIIYNLIKIFNSLKHQPSPLEVRHLLAVLNSWETAPNEQKDTLALLSSLIHTEDWSELKQLGEALAAASFSAEFLARLTACLKQVNFEASQPVPLSKVLEFVAKLQKFPNAMQLSKEELVLFCTKNIRSLVFNYEDLSQKMTGIVLSIAAFTEELQKAVDSLSEEFNKSEEHANEVINEFINDPNFNPLPQENKSGENVGKDENDPGIIKLLKKTIEHKIQTLIEHFRAHVINIITKLEEIKLNPANPDKLKNALNAVQNLLNFIKDPLAHIDGIAFARPILNRLFLKKYEKQLIQQINEEFLSILYREVTQEVQKLKINQKVADNIGEQVSLADVFNRFLHAYIPPLQGKELTVELDNSFKSQEQIMVFLKELQANMTSEQCALFIALLYEHHYLTQYTDLFATRLPLIKLTQFIAALPAEIELKPLFKRIFSTVTAANRDFIESVLKKLKDEGRTCSPKQKLIMAELALNSAPKSAVEQEEALAHLTALMNVSNLLAKDHPLLNLLMDSKFKTTDLANIHLLIHCVPSLSREVVVAFIEKQLPQAESSRMFTELSKLLQKYPHQIETIITLLNNAVWNRSEEPATIDEQIVVIERLISKTQLDFITNTLYRYHPAPGFKALQTEVNKEPSNLELWVKEYELDPFGHRHKVMSHYQTQGISSFTQEIKDLFNQHPLPANIQQQLLDAATYILSIGNDYSLPIGNELKPLSQFRRTELGEFFKQCCIRIQDGEQRAIYETLAVFNEVFFRSTGRFPYPSQIISALCTQLIPGNLLLQIQTGQGKTTTLALTAALTYALAPVETHVTVCSRNQILTQRDYEECKPFYDYLNIPVAMVQASTQENCYDKPSVVYSTTADKSLYDSRLQIVENQSIPPASQQVVICDEVDAEFFDNKNAFNFSETKEDPFVNPLEWVYPLANEFITLPQFMNLFTTEGEDVLLFRNFLKAKSPELYKQYRERLTDEKIDQLLDAACVAQQLRENYDFVIRQRKREVHGQLQTISEAHVLEGHTEDKEATLSHGVQQCLHARLNKMYSPAISLYDKNVHKPNAMPPFSCDNQIDAVDSQNSHSFLKKFGRIIGGSGTLGSPQELEEVRSTLEMNTILDIPPRKRSGLHYLSTVFCDDRTSFFFKGDNQLKAIIRALDKARLQPVMISCAHIQQADQWKEELEKKYPGKVQVIHALVAEDQKEFEDRVARAKEVGQITLVTPLAGRGVDIKTPKASDNGTARERQLSQLAERLLVIETHLERYRNRRQLQGRSARDGKSGETLGIFNLDTIAREHGLTIKIKNRKDKLRLLEQLMEKMDTEAAVERQISTQKHSLIVYFEKLFEEEIAKNPEMKEDIRHRKALFIERAEHLWHNTLAEIDPEGEFPNPYVRYKDGHLDRASLENALITYQEKLRELFRNQMHDLGFLAEVAIDARQIYSYKKEEHRAAAVVEEPEAIALNLKSQTQTYLELSTTNDPRLSLYQNRLKAHEMVTKHLETGLKRYQMNHTRELTTAIQKTLPTALTQHSYLGCFTQALRVENRFLTHSELLGQYQMALDKVDNLNEAHPQEKTLVAAELKGMVAAMLTSFLNSVIISAQDKNHLQQLQAILEKSNIPETFAEYTHVFNRLYHLYQPLITQPEVKERLMRVHDFVMTTATKVEAIAPLAENKEIQLTKQAVQKFLEQTIARLATPEYRNKHSGAQAKIDEIQQFIAQELNNPSEDMDGPSWLEKIKPILDRVLAQNTRVNLRVHTQSQREWHKLYPQLVKTCTSAEPATMQFITRLEQILRDLQNRSTKGFFKNRELYEIKIKNLNDYIAHTKKAIAEGPDATAIVRMLRDQVNQDEQLTKSTSKIPLGSVTVIKEVNALTEEFLKIYS